MDDVIRQGGPRTMHVLKCTQVEPRAPFDFVGSSSSTGSNKETEPRALLPLRLIDVNATLNDLLGRVHFVTPKDWRFHVISHTWSQDIRALSKKIGSYRGRIRFRHKGDAYKAASLCLDLSSDSGFVALKEFLGLLSSDGVEWVWMDALCINQCDENEKSREICSMAAFYRFSQGCYVSTHGLGQGFHLWSSMNEQQVAGWVARWFERGWTFQELLLPQTLHFIVDGLTQSTIANLNIGIAKAGKGGFCVCCIRKSPGFMMNTFAHAPPVVDCSTSAILCHDMDFRCENNVIMENEEHQLCSECRQPDLIRKVKIKDITDTYFVDRIAYFFVVQASLGTQIMLNLPYNESPVVPGESDRKKCEQLDMMECQSNCEAEFRLLFQRFEDQLLHSSCEDAKNQRGSLMKRYSFWKMFFITQLSSTHFKSGSATEYFRSILLELAIQKDKIQNMISPDLWKQLDHLNLLDLDEPDYSNLDLQESSEFPFGIALKKLINRMDRRSLSALTEVIYKCAFGRGALQKEKKRVSGIVAAQGIRRLSNLYRLLTKTEDSGSSPSPIELLQVVHEIRTRDCSVGEDRILSILGLIPGMQVMKQVRTGKSLNSQLVDLARICNDKTVFDLCLMDKSNDSPGMSWAPKLTPQIDHPYNEFLDLNNYNYDEFLGFNNSNHDEFLDLNYPRVTSLLEVAEGSCVENVTPHGIIIICGLIYGHFHESKIFCDYEFSCNHEHCPHEKPNVHGELRLCNGNHVFGIPVEYTNKTVGKVITFPKRLSCIIPELMQYRATGKLKSDVMFLILGKSDEKHLLSMMCVPYQIVGDLMVLEKVGVVALLQDEVNNLIQPNTRCCVAGRGNYEHCLRPMIEAENIYNQRIYLQDYEKRRLPFLKKYYFQLKRKMKTCKT